MIFFLHASTFLKLTALLNIPFIPSLASTGQLPAGLAWLINLQKLKLTVWNAMLPSKRVPKG